MGGGCGGTVGGGGTALLVHLLGEGWDADFADQNLVSC